MHLSAKKSISLPIAALLLAGIAVAQKHTKPSARAQHVILISVDGMTPVEYLHPDEHHLQIPNLRALAATGCPADGMTGVFPASTYPSHTSMITGQTPAVHGVISNTPIDPLNLENGGWYYYFDKIEVPTLWQRLQEAHLETAAVSWPVTVGAPVNLLLPEYRPVRDDEDRSLMRVLSTPGLFREMEALSPGLIPMTDEWRTNAVVKLITTRKPALLALHLSDLDEEQHKYGPHTPQTHAQLETIDTEIGKIRAAVQAAGIADQTAFVIVSDHGFLPLDKLVHPTVLLHDAGLITTDKAGKVTSWKVYFRNHTGSMFLEAKDPNDTESIAKATELMRKLAADPANGIAKIDTPADLKVMGADPGAFLALEAAKGYGIGSDLTGPVVTQLPSVHGAHGYNPSVPEMRPSMILSGAGIDRCQLLEGVSITDVGPTAAALLGVSMPGTAGHNVNVPHKP